ncbi:hypothetical protein WJX73_004281 [Symbiochloris irregularis]
MDPRHREPKFTSMSKNFKGTLDYILYTSDSLVPTAALDLPEDSEVSTPEGGPGGQTARNRPAQEESRPPFTGS